MTLHQPLDHILQSIYDQAWNNVSDSVGTHGPNPTCSL